jgi:ABC-2 type transport system permease protein
VSGAALAWQQFRLERKLFWRNPSAAFFGFVLPMVLLLLLASTVANDPEDLDVLIPGIAGLSVMATTFNSMAYSLTFLREQGILKRLRGTPIPAPAYFAGFLGNAVANAFVQVALVVLVGHLVYDVTWPRDWLELVVFTVVGVVTFGALGIALSHVIPNFDSAPAYVNAIFLPAILISGVFYSAEGLPKAIEAIAEALPLKHVIDGFSDAIVEGRGLGHELGALAVLAAWGVVGVFFAIRGFRWNDDG